MEQDTRRPLYTKKCQHYKKTKQNKILAKNGNDAVSHSHKNNKFYCVFVAVYLYVCMPVHLYAHTLVHIHIHTVVHSHTYTSVHIHTCTVTQKKEGKITQFRKMSPSVVPCRFMSLKISNLRRKLVRTLSPNKKG